MTNKTSDKNVANIEDDVDELKSIMNLRTDSGFAYSQKNTLSLQKAIKNVLADYTRQKEMNEEHQKINGELRQAINTVEKEKGEWIKAYQEEKDSQFDLLKRIKELEEQVETKQKFIIMASEVIENSILEQAVIDKINEYDKKMEEDAGHPHWVVTDRIVMNVLQELLEGGK